MIESRALAPKVFIRSAMLAAATVLTLSALTSCGGGGDDAGDDRLSFEDAVDQGASCEELFDIRNSWDPKSPLIEPANETLRSIGCFSSSSERTDQ